MRKDIKEKWVAALRSGKYKQGNSYLQRKEPLKFCCLGVLVNLIKDEFDIETETDGWDNAVVYRRGDDKFEKTLPPSLQDDLGFVVEQQTALIALNDGDPYTRVHTFSEIADWIEANVEETA